MPNRWHGGWLGHTLSRHPIDPLPWGVIGYQRQIDQTLAHLRNDDHPAQPHGIVTNTQTLGMRVGTLATSLGWTRMSAKPQEPISGRG
eukprot:scaffold47028_cov87-Phaeocystis_antarctica.AAC.5